MNDIGRVHVVEPIEHLEKDEFDHGLCQFYF